METEEITKLVDGIYKNILDKFNPGARQLINAGKTYLKALHGAAAASKIYVDAINKLARQAQQGTWGGSSDVGSALVQIVEVYKEIQNQQMNILKAFYVDLLVPLETNLEKDTKVVQSEQKRFLQQHKLRSESYSKAAATMKKQRKKNKGTTKTGLAMDKEVKNMQLLEEERSKLDAFCEQSLKTAMTQERRRYGFVLERQCSLAKHYLAYHSQGSAVLQRHLEDWQDIAQTREYLPDNVDSIFTNKLRQVSFWPDEDVYSSPRSPNMDDDRLSIASQLRKTKSMDASCLDMRSINDITSPMKPLSRAKSDFNLTASTHSLAQDADSHTMTRPKSIAVERGTWDSHLARALYAYLSSGDNQLSFLEGDVIALMGDRNKGWQFGENLRTQASGWFPLAYTEVIMDDAPSSPTHMRMQSYDSTGSSTSTSATTPATPTVNGIGTSSFSGGTLMSPGGGARTGKTIALIEPRPSGVTMFGDTLMQRSATAKQMRRGRGICVSVGPPPMLPAPVIPTYKMQATLPANPRAVARLVQPPPMPPLPSLLGNASKRAPGVIGGGVGVIGGGGNGNASLHSSNDSGFSNDPPPAPEVDYSDDDSTRKANSRRKRSSKKPRQDDVTKSRLLSSVRGWLLYKSAMDLWEDVNNQENIPSRPRQLPIARQNSAITLNRSHDNLMTPTEHLTLKKHNSEATGVKRSKSLWRFKKNDVDVGLVEGMSLWQHRSLVDVNAAAEAEKRDEKNRKCNPKGTPIMRTKLVPVKCGSDTEETMHDFSKQRGEDYKTIDLGYETVHSPELKQKKKLKRTDIDDDDDDGLKMSSIPDYDTDVSRQGDTESCIVVDDHLKASTLRNRSHQNGAILPRTKLFAKYSMTLGSRAKVKEDDDDGGFLYYGKTLEKRMSQPERGSRFDQMSTTTGNMCGPWYDLWGVDQSVKK